MNFNETQTVGDPMESGLNKDSITTSITLRKDMTDEDRIQLRYYLRTKLNQWRDTHANQSLVNLADLMSESLLQDEPR